MNNIERYKKAVDHWYDVSSKYRDDGAADSEPIWKFRKVVSTYANEGNNVLPLSPDQWELYTCERPCKRAANALNSATQKVLDILDKVPITEKHKIREQYGNHFV